MIRVRVLVPAGLTDHFMTQMAPQIVACNISSYLPGQICTFLMNMHLEKRPIWLTRHGQSVYNMESRIGGGVQALSCLCACL